MIENWESVDVFIGVDVGKSGHHAVTLARDGKTLFDKTLPQDEARLRETRHAMIRCSMSTTRVRQRRSGPCAEPPSGWHGNLRRNG